MTDQIVNPAQKNKMANIALGAVIVNLICWALVAIPGFLLSAWSMFELVVIPLSAAIALAAGILGMRRVKINGMGTWQSGFGIMVGILNILLIGVSLAGIYAMVNCPC